MVAPKWKRARDVGAVLLLVALLAAPFVPNSSGQVPPVPTTIPTITTPTPTEQTTAPPILVLERSSVVVTQGSSIGPFINNNSTSGTVVTFTITNTGGRADAVGVFAFADMTDQPNAYSDTIQCQVVRVNGVTGSVPGRASVSMGIPVPFLVTNATSETSAHEAIHAILYRLQVNAKPADWPQTTNNCGGKAFNTFNSGGAAQGNKESDLTDNVAFVQITKDAKLDFNVDSIEWCRGPATTATVCDTNFTHGMTGAPYNTVRHFHEEGDGLYAPPDNEGNATYFRVRIGTNNSTIYTADGPVGWIRPDLRDYASEYCDFDYPPLQSSPTNPKGIGTDTQDPNGITLNKSTCPIYNVSVDIRVGRTEATAPSSPIVLSDAGWSLGQNGQKEQALNGTWHSRTLDLLDNFTRIALAGGYNVSANVNQDGTMQEVLQTNDLLVRPFTVLAPDLAASLVREAHGMTLTDPYTYPANNSFTIGPFTAVLSNGGAAPVKFSSDSVATRLNIPWRLIIDNDSTRTGYSVTDTWTAPPDSADPLSVKSVSKNLLLSSLSSSPSFITPGPHSLCLQVDHTNLTNESDDANNVDCVTIFLRDSGKPIIEPMFGSTAPRVVYQAFTDDIIPNGRLHPKENFSAFINISDNDQVNLNVTLMATLSSDHSIQRSWYPCDPIWDDKQDNCVFFRNNTANAYGVHVRNFVFANASNTTEDWTLTAVARDTFDNNVTSPATALQLRHWPIHSMTAKQVIAGICDERKGFAPGSNDCLGFFNDSSTFPYRTGAPQGGSLEFHLEGAWTGYAGYGPADQANVTSNLAELVYLPGGNASQPVVIPADHDWNQITCTSTGSTTGIPIPVGKTNPCATYGSVGNFTSSGVMSLRSSTGVGGPGKWNLSIRITDWGGESSDFNFSFNLSDLPPVISGAQLNASDLAAGKPLDVHVNVTDDFELNQTFLNFTRVSDNHTFPSIPIGNFTNPPNADGVSYVYNDTITTGHGHTLGNAGDYRVVFAAIDSFGNWNTSNPIAFKLNDSTAPSLLEATVTPAQQEATLNVTFHALATDESNETVILQVLLRGNEEVVRVNMTEDQDHLGNFTYTTSFATEGSYTYNIWAIDSVNLQSSVATGALSIKDNLGPRFDIRQPSSVVLGQRYAKAAPTFDVLVYDSDNVSLDSIALTIGGVAISNADMVRTPAGPDPKGFVLTYTVPATSKFNHNDTVDVNLTAIDLSVKQLQGWFNFTLRIDDVPPTTQMLPFHPASRADQRNVWNVSLQTQFTLVASDDDGMPTDVSLIQYQVCPLLCSNPSSGTTGSYSGPFAIKDVPGVYTGPRIYEIDYWSYDTVGNTNRTPERQLVYVDDLAPSLDPFGSEPQGRFVNVTLIDDRSGVDRAVVWWRLNTQPYAPVPLDFVNGVWSTILPEGKKGDRMSYYLQAWDRVQNTATFGNASVPHASFPVDNHNPFIKITSPADGSKIARQVQLTWNASDQDNDPLLFTVFYKAPPKTTYVELAKLESPDARSYVLDTTHFQDGQYTFRVTANDGNAVVMSETTVTIQNAASAVRTVPPIADTTPGTPVLITAEITKANAVVEARVSRDGKFVNAYPMNDEGRDGDKTANDGIYSVRVAFGASGQYSVQIFTRYQEDGQLKENTVDGPTFGVKLTPAGVFSEYGTIIVAVGLLAVAGVGIAAYVLMRRR